MKRTIQFCLVFVLVALFASMLFACDSVDSDALEKAIDTYNNEKDNNKEEKDDETNDETNDPVEDPSASIRLTAGSITESSVAFRVVINDPTETGRITKIELFDPNGNVVESTEDPDTRIFTDLQPNTKYKVSVEYLYTVEETDKRIVKTLSLKTNKKNEQPTPEQPEQPVASLTPAKDIQTLADLSDYSERATYYGKESVTFEDVTYDGRDATEQLYKLNSLINSKKNDVLAGNSDSTFVKIFAMSTANGLMQKMAKAALSYDEMVKVVDYLYGTAENPDLDAYIVYSEGRWTGVFADGRTSWRERKVAETNADFNTEWSLIDDWDLLSRLIDYARNKSNQDIDLTNDNVAWQIRSMVKKAYQEVGLSGDAAARLATYLLEYAVEIVEEKSHGTVSESAFANYCKTVADDNDFFSGLGDYNTLSFLLAFDEFYEDGTTDGVKKCVKLFGYLYDFAKTIYQEAFADESIFAKQLYYAKVTAFTDAEWLDCVAIQRNNYVKAFRYTATFYRKFLNTYLEFQELIEEKEEIVYRMNEIRSTYSLENSYTTFTTEIRTGMQTTSIDAINGFLALLDWIWCYTGSDTVMKQYNQANTKYQNGMNSGAFEHAYEGKFSCQMEHLKLIYYLLEKMSISELSSLLYGTVYAYSASMINDLNFEIKNICLIDDKKEDGSRYTTIPFDIHSEDRSRYAKEKLAVIYKQGYNDWAYTQVRTLGSNAAHQNWAKIAEEVRDVIEYDYLSMQFKKESERWQERCERMDDLLIQRVWSCCGQKVHEADDAQCPYGHVRNEDGSPATKNYDPTHTISRLISDYENIFYRISGNSTLTFCAASNGFRTNNTENTKTWTTGYYGTIAELRADRNNDRLRYDVNEPVIELVILTGDTIQDDFKSQDWWRANKTSCRDAKFGPEEYSEFDNGANTMYVYTYEFTGWYLDQDCKFAFDEHDPIPFDLTIYAGYNLTKSRK